MPSQQHEPFRDLGAEHRRAVSMLAPLLRIAVALDTSREQKIEHMQCRSGDGGASLTLRGKGEFDLEIWAAERAGNAFREVYGLPLVVEKERA